EGQCSEGKGPGKGRSPTAARAPLCGPSGFVHLGLRHFLEIERPGILARSRLTCAVHLVTSAVLDPSTLPSWTHEDTSVHARGRDRSPEERRARHFNSGGDEASFTSGVPHHMPPDLAVSVPLLSRTPTPVGSLVKGGRYGRGDDDN
ncbi:hypothetical protein M9458_038062, partial [Cirrhinus mrigala]